MSKYWKIFIGCVVAMVAVLFLLVMYLLEKPDPTVDYFAQYNDLTRPESYDPKQDAAEQLKNMPEPEYTEDEWDLNSVTYEYEVSDYPHKFSPEDIQKLEKWLAKNQARLNAILEASRKPYCYRPVDASDWKTEALADGFFTTENFSFYEITQLLSWAAVYHLNKGEVETTVRYLQASLDFYRMLRPHAGYYQQYEVASLIEDLSFIFACVQDEKLSSDTLKAIQRMLLDAELDYSYDDTVAKLCFYDFVQKYYTPGDHGHLAPITYIKQEMGMFDWDSAGQSLRYIYEAFNGERRKKVIDRMESIFARLNELKDLPVGRQVAEGVSLQSELSALAGDSTFVKQQADQLLRQFCLPYQSACTLNALAAAIAIELYRRDKGQYPETLEDLLSETYLDRLPEDAFSGKPLFYRKQAEGFILYSVGIDGQDDGGCPAICKNCGDHLTDWGDGPVFRPGSPKELDPADPKDAYADHIFWPPMEMDSSTGQLSPSDIFQKTNN